MIKSIKTKVLYSFILATIIINVQARSFIGNPFELLSSPPVHHIKDCIQVTSDEGDFQYRKIPYTSVNNQAEEISIIDARDPMTVCGLFIIGEPDTIVEITIKHLDVSCETQGLMGFVDGWELNGEYFPGEKEHIKPLDERTIEFCSDYRQLLKGSHQRVLRSSQNAALLQYRVPVQGSFEINVRFHKINQPCNILAFDEKAQYTLKNFNHRRNCSLTAIYPAVISLMNFHVGGYQNINEEDTQCQLSDRLEIGGTSGLDSNNMLISTQICGHSHKQGPAQAIFCGVSTVRLVSSGNFNNNATIFLHKADEKDFPISSLICP